jgi:hypothetical protein
MGAEESLALVAGKLDTLRLLGETGMLWWVSSSALVTAMLGGVWLKREALSQIRSRRLVVGLCVLIGWFILSIVVYGGRSIWAVISISRDVSDICAAASLPCADVFLSDFSMARDGYVIGTTTFILALVAWIGMSRAILVEQKSVA